MSNEFGSVTNMLLGTEDDYTPKVGDGATHLGYTDRNPYTIIEVVLYKSGKLAGTARMVKVQADDCKRVDKNGMSECQDYEYTPNPNAEVVEVTRRKDGQWKDKKDRAFRLGEREKYHDFSF